jgi:predicted esterase
MLGFSAGAAVTLGTTLTAPTQATPAFIGLLYSPPQPVALPPKIPPLFAGVASDDTVVGPDKSIVDAWHAAGQSAEYHLYARGGHGFGMRKTGATTDLWPEEFLAWLRSNGFLSKPTQRQVEINARP